MEMTSKFRHEAFLADTYKRFPVQIVRGKGSLVYDEKGKEYIDFNSGIAVNTFGMCDDEWIAAVTAQMQKFQHTSNLFYNNPAAELAEKLCMRTGAKRVFFSNSGAEANECALKIAKKYALYKKGEGNHTIISMQSSFHGRTMATLAATGQEALHDDFLPLPERYIYVRPNDTMALNKAMNENGVAAVIVEIVQGEGGVKPLEQAYLKSIESFCRQKSAVFIIDEVQTGNGRTGSLFAYEQYGLKPDVVTTAKGLGGGLPIGATLLFNKVEDVLTQGSHGSTFGGNPLACAGALSILNRIDDDLLADVRKKSKYLIDKFKDAEGVNFVTGLGLMLGIDTKLPVADILDNCISLGVLPIRAKEKIRILPPLNIPFDLLEKGTDLLLKAIRGEHA